MITTGELPMDEASRVVRQRRQTHPETYIHGSKSGGILEIDPEKSGATNPNARGTGQGDQTIHIKLAHGRAL